MINLIDMLVLNTHLGIDVNKVVEDYQIANDCTEEEAIEALVNKCVEVTMKAGAG